MISGEQVLVQVVMVPVVPAAMVLERILHDMVRQQAQTINHLRHIQAELPVVRHMTAGELMKSFLSAVSMMLISA